MRIAVCCIFSIRCRVEVKYLDRKIFTTISIQILRGDSGDNAGDFMSHYRYNVRSNEASHSPASKYAHFF